MVISDQLVKQIKEKESPIVVGLDPQYEQLPNLIREISEKKWGETLEAVGDAIFEFNKGIIDAIYDIVPAVKPQIAYYEQYGIPGLIAYQKTCTYAKEKGLIVIGDIKRSDIGSTSEAYARAHIGKTAVGSQNFEAFPADLVTINPYMGTDTILPFLQKIEAYEKGIFVLVKTSNPSSKEIQDQCIGNIPLYEKVAECVNDWGKDSIGSSGYSAVGAVVGATYPEEMKKLRAIMPNAYFLVPGYGAQGATASDIVHAFNEDGLGAVINSSRGIIYAYQKLSLPYQDAARQSTLAMKKDITEALRKRK
jgi:orotidine-5'-phosphate decarboxylase